MKSGRASRRSIRYSILIGVLAGSVFSASGAVAEVIPLSEISAQITDGNVSLVAGATYEAGNPSDTYAFGMGSTYFGDFSGSFLGNGATITGLTVPLFNVVGTASSNISNLNLIASVEDDLIGNGILANVVLAGSTIDEVHVSGDVNSSNFEVGGLVGNSAGTITNSSSSGSVTGISKVGGLVGLADGLITGSSSSSTVSSLGGNQVGGLVGEGSAVIQNSHASGTVTAANGMQVGGLIGNAAGNISDSYATGITEGYDSVGGLIGYARAIEVTNSYATGVVTGHSDNIGGLIGDIQGEVTNSYATGDVSSAANYVGGLIGRMQGSISNSYSTSNVNVNSHGLLQRIGGLVGGIENFIIENSYSSGAVTATVEGSSGSLGNIGSSYVAGLVGSAINGEVINSYSTSNVTATTEAADTGLIFDVSANNSYLAGLIGFANDVNATNSVATGFVNSDVDIYVNGDVTSNVTVTSTSIGGLIGYAGCYLSCSPSELQVLTGISSGNVSSRVSADIQRVHGNLIVYNEYVGKLIGNTNDLSISNSYSTSEVTAEKYKSTYSLDGTLTFYNQNVGNLIGYEGLGTSLTEEFRLLEIPSLISVIAKDGSIGSGEWNSRTYCNSGLPYLVSLESKYSPSCVELTSEATGPNERKVRMLLELNKVKEIQKTLGFKIESPLPKTAPIAFVEANTKIDIANVKAVEIAPTANVRVATKAGEALQISLKSESKEPVELWVKSPDGTWLLAGVITFDKDGKAILPPLQFKNVGNYSLVLNKPSADSAKGSAPLNQTGSLLVAVS